MLETFFVFTRLFEILVIINQMNSVEPITSTNPFSTRVQIASAIVDATTDLDDRALLVSIAKWESFLRTDVLRCSHRGGGVALGPWQVAPRSPQERKMLCTDLISSAKLVLERVEESKQLCKHLPERDRLAIYTAGDCKSSQGRSLSRMRIDTAKKLNTIED